MSNQLQRLEIRRLEKKIETIDTNISNNERRKNQLEFEIDQLKTSKKYFENELKELESDVEKGD